MDYKILHLKLRRSLSLFKRSSRPGSNRKAPKFIKKNEEHNDEIFSKKAGSIMQQVNAPIYHLDSLTFTLGPQS